MSNINKVIYDPIWKISENKYKCPHCGVIKTKERGIIRHIYCCLGYNTSWNKGLTKESDKRLLDQSNSFREKFISGKIIVKGHKVSDETKKILSEKRIKYLQDNPEKAFYKKYHSSKGPSYAEKYFKEVFEKENIPLKFHFSIGSYELDFYNQEKGIDLEINGHQHYDDKRIVESDKKRTAYLENLGWKIITIRWSDYANKTLEEKKQIVKEIKNIVENSKNVEDLDRLLQDNKQFKKDKKDKESAQRKLIQEQQKLINEQQKSVEKQIKAEQKLSRKIFKDNKKHLQQIKGNEYRKILLENINSRKNKILNSNINFKKYGWVEQVKNILGISHTQVKRFMKKYLKEFYNQCYHKKTFLIR